MKLRCLVWEKILKTWRPRHQSGIRVREEMLVEPADHSVYIDVEGVASAECRPRGRAGRDVLNSIQQHLHFSSKPSGKNSSGNRQQNLNH